MIPRALLLPYCPGVCGTAGNLYNKINDPRKWIMPYAKNKVIKRKDNLMISLVSLRLVRPVPQTSCVTSVFLSI